MVGPCCLRCQRPGQAGAFFSKIEPLKGGPGPKVLTLERSDHQSPVEALDVVPRTSEAALAVLSQEHQRVTAYQCQDQLL